MDQSDRIKRTVVQMVDVAKKYVDDPENQNAEDISDADKFMQKMNKNVERTQSQGENIISRMRAGVISGDAARKQMKTLLTNQCGELIGVLAKYKGIAPEILQNEELIEQAMKDVASKLG